MSNTLTALAPILYSAARIVPKELTGFLGAVSLDFDDNGVAKGQTVTVPVMPALAIGNTTAAQTFTAGTDLTAGSKVLTLNNAKEVSWNYTAEEEKGLTNSGVRQDAFKQTVEQGIRIIRNTIETSLWTTCKNGASRAFGTAATVPFATTMLALTGVSKILQDNGAYMPGNMSLVIDTNAGMNLRNLSNLFKVNEGGSSDTLRQGVLGSLYGYDIRESAAIGTTVAGTGANYVVGPDAGNAIGDTAIIADVGSGTILAGDTITISGDANKYVVNGALGSGVVTIGEPGLKQAWADEAAITVGSIATAHIALNRNAVKAVIRPAIQPVGGAVESMVISDSETGFSFLMTRAVGKLMTSYYMNVVYDSFVPNTYGVAQLIG